MTALSDRNTVAPPAPVLTPRACLRSSTHNAIPFHFRIRLPECGHRPPCKGKLQRCELNRSAGTIATDPASANQMPIAPRH